MKTKSTSSRVLPYFFSGKLDGGGGDDAAGPVDSLIPRGNHCAAFAFGATPELPAAGFEGGAPVTVPVPVTVLAPAMAPVFADGPTEGRVTAGLAAAWLPAPAPALLPFPAA
jgi:hypothetical protein